MASDKTSPVELPEYLRGESTQEYKDIIASLPSHESWVHGKILLYQGFWYHTNSIRGIIAFQKHFEAQESDVLLASSMKAGTTWMKALIFAVMNRHRFLNLQEHPLLHSNPHGLVLTMEFDVYGKLDSADLSLLQSPRLFATHMPFGSLPTSLQDSNCKIVYIGRNPKDLFISRWHFVNKVKPESMEDVPLEVALDMFCKGLKPWGPVWDHVLSYWNESLKRSEKILFLKYEDLKESPLIHIRRLADFLGCPFSDEEEKQSVIDNILELCSFKSLSQLQVNKTGKLWKGVENNTLFRKGDVGDWQNYLTPEMAAKIDNITAEKWGGTGLEQ